MDLFKVLFILPFFMQWNLSTTSKKSRKRKPMAFFNSFQLTVLFAAWPFIIGWLKTQPFEYSGALFWVAIVAYLIHFGFTVFATADQLDYRR